MSKILVVDDDPALHQVIESALVREGHSLLRTTDGKQGMELLAHEKIDLAIIDYVTPGMNGLEFLEEARSDHPDLKAIVITASGTPEAVLGALRKKVCDFLVKPFGVAEIRAAVSAALTENSAPELGDMSEG